MQVINNQQSRRPKNQYPDWISPFHIHILAQSINPKQKPQIWYDNTDSLKIDRWIALIVEAIVHVNDLGVDILGENGKEAF